ncbi:methyltransferase [Azospirillum palustre]|uniref:Protein MgtC n=1 Tax=Azospirillum palustre TaxID=2044885 RepID=A0A2B8BNJ4_9PROT|nr:MULTISPECIES: MgtC/SapB family protein [Azospirillum]KAA0571150.1 MgtC/SapB family protein [Azospirillum sp. B21]PGH59425.1 methyltransferase [Azospirillum palustre]
MQLDLSDAAVAATTFIRFALAFILGALIGFERQYRQRTAGLRTNVLVAVGAAAFAEIGMRLLGPEGATRIVAYVVSGIGFLGAGVIMKEGTNVRGLNTAATLWCSAAVGACSGCGLPLEAVMLTFFVLAGNTLLRPLVNYVNRLPIDERVTEALYRVHVVADPDGLSDVRDALASELEALDYPIRDIELLSESEEQVELAAVLVPTTANPGELDRAVLNLEKTPGIKSATWTVSTTT